MKTSLRFVHAVALSAALSGLLLSSGIGMGAPAAAAPTTSDPSPNPNPNPNGVPARSPAKSGAGQQTPGLKTAQALTTITGVAISPLLGVSGVGAWTWWRTAPAARPNLPWYAQPWFWGSALVLVGLTLIKDSFGTALPTVMKKPFDVAETIEDKISGLLAAGAFVPLIVTIAADSNTGAFYEGTGLAMIELVPLLNLIAVPLAIAAFLVVWMVSHVVHVLILISPFTTIDAALKAARLLVLSLLTATAFINPYVGAALSVALILVCLLLAGWSFRLMVFGTVFTWDMITIRKSRFNVAKEANWVFTARAIGQAPIRSFGRLTRGADGELTLSYRPWLCLARRTLALPPASYAVGRGLFYSEISADEGEGTTITPTLTLLPRHRTHEEELNSLYVLGGVREVGVIKGFREFWAWLRELCGLRLRLPGLH